MYVQCLINTTLGYAPKHCFYVGNRALFDILLRMETVHKVLFNKFHYQFTRITSVSINPYRRKMKLPNLLRLQFYGCIHVAQYFLRYMQLSIVSTPLDFKFCIASSPHIIYAHAYTHVYMHTHACTCTYTCTLIHVHVHMHMHACTHTYTCTCMHVHVHTHAHSYMYTYILIHTHT